LEISAYWRCMSGSRGLHISAISRFGRSACFYSTENYNGSEKSVVIKMGVILHGMDVPFYRLSRISNSDAEFGRFRWPDWSLAEPIEFLKIRHEPEDGLPLRERTQVAALWDERNLYLTFAVFDKGIWATITTRDARLFHEECVEFFIDPDGDGRRYVETQVNSLGTVRDLLVDGTISHPTPLQYDAMALWRFRALRSEVSELNVNHRRVAGWRLQVAIPWVEFDFSHRAWPPQPGDELRINFYRYERPQSGIGSLELSGWSCVQGSFHQPGCFGRFIFQSNDDH